MNIFHEISGVSGPPPLLGPVIMNCGRDAPILCRYVICFDPHGQCGTTGAVRWIPQTGISVPSSKVGPLLLVAVEIECQSNL